MKNALRLKTRKQISAELGIHPSTLRRRLRALNRELPTGDVSPKDQKFIYELYGYPKSVNKDDYKNV
ncbi:MAG: hypothetical protein Kow0027_13540 [Saprospiraceae bacterium]